MSLDGETESVLWLRTPTGIGTVSQCRTPTGPKTPGVLGIGTSKNETPGKRLIQSPRVDVVIYPNDDEREKARARSARAEQRRRSFGGHLQPAGTGQSAPPEQSNILSPESLSALLQNCLKLANANKINQGNTWNLGLIDHLSDLVKTDIDDPEETNFQLASCSLDAGVKIYSTRVDSVHSEAYKLLGGLGRSANEQITTEFSPEGDQGSSVPQGRKEASRKGATLLASNESINLKKIDVAFNVDPLFHQTSALFDDGAVRGLLLHNLSVYSGCEVLFDSSEVPELNMKAQAALVKEGSQAIDLAFMQDTLERMMDVLGQEPEMTPTLKDIVNLLDDPRRAEFEVERAEGGHVRQSPDSVLPDRSWADSAGSDAAQDDDPGEIFNVDVGFDSVDTGGFNSPDSATWSDTNGDKDDEDDVGDDSGDVFLGQEPLEWLALIRGMPIESNAWTGPDHWKYPKPKDDPNGAPADREAKEKSGRKRKEPFFIDCKNPPEIDFSAFNFSPKNRRSLLLPQSSIPRSTLLPEDYHFEAASLAKFTLRPSIWIFQRRSKRSEQGSRATNFPDMNNETLWDDDDPSGGWEDEAGHSDVEDPMNNDLVSEPRKVQNVSITYDKHSKQVDVRLLKGVLWEQLQNSSSENDQEKSLWNKEDGLSFQEILQHFPEDCPAAAPKDISVHLCFISLLHLANEHGLRIIDCLTMDDLRIFVA